MNIHFYNQGYPKDCRLRKKNDFELLYLDAKNTTFGSIKIYYKKSPSETCPRLGISISSKYFNSVQRNSLKRIIREFFRKNITLFDKIDLVVAVRYSKIDKNNGWKAFLIKVKSDLKNIVSKLKL